MSQGELDTWVPMAKVLTCLQSEEYCLVKKRRDLSSVPHGSDVDLYVGNLAKARTVIRAGLSDLVDSEIKLREEVVGPDHVHIDLRSRKALILRFDLYARTPAFKRLQLTPQYFHRVLESRQIELLRGPGGETIQLYVPSKEMEYVLRVCEYAEFYWIGPDKIQHVDYLLDSSDLTRQEGLRILHEVTKVPTPNWDAEKARSNIPAKGVLKEQLQRLYRYLASIPVFGRIRDSRVGSYLESLARKTLKKGHY